MKTNALWHLDSNRSALQETSLTEQEDDQYITIKSLYSLISTGTENLVATGRVPKALHQVMGVPYMDGDFSFPIKYGYSCLLYTSPSPRDRTRSRMPSSA